MHGSYDCAFKDICQNDIQYFIQAKPPHLPAHISNRKRDATSPEITELNVSSSYLFKLILRHRFYF